MLNQPQFNPTPRVRLRLLRSYLCLRSSHRPLFVRMTPLQSDWSPMGLKGIIPSLLHHTLLGYNFLIPDAVGNTTADGSLFSPLIVLHMHIWSVFLTADVTQTLMKHGWPSHLWPHTNKKKVLYRPSCLQQNVPYSRINHCCSIFWDFG